MPALAALLRQAISVPISQRLYGEIRHLLTDPQGDDESLIEGLRKIQGRLSDYLVEDPGSELAFERFAAVATLGGWETAKNGSLHANARPSDASQADLAPSGPGNGAPPKKR
jgi:hypothetical protein